MSVMKYELINMNLKLYLITATLCFSVNNNLTASSLEEVVYYSSVDKIKKLLEGGASTEETDEDGNTPLIIASANGR